MAGLRCTRRPTGAMRESPVIHSSSLDHSRRGNQTWGRVIAPSARARVARVARFATVANDRRRTRRLRSPPPPRNSVSRVARRSVWFALFLALPASTEARAQPAGPTLELGERVRVSARDYRPYTEYIFEGRSGDSLQFRHVGTTLTHWKHERDVRRLGRFVRPRSRGMGAVRGLRWAVVGVALGAAIGAVQKDCTGCLESPTKGERMRMAATELGGRQRHDGGDDRRDRAGRRVAAHRPAESRRLRPQARIPPGIGATDSAPGRRSVRRRLALDPLTSRSPHSGQRHRPRLDHLPVEQVHLAIRMLRVP